MAGEPVAQGLARPAEAALERLWSEASASVLSAGYFACAPDWQLLERTRAHYQLWLITDGWARLTVGSRRFDLSPGAVLLIPPNVPHRGIHDPAQPLHCFVLHGHIRVLGATVPDALAALPPVAYPPPEVWQQLLAHAAVICRELVERRPGYALLANSHLGQLVGLLWREAAAQGVLDPARAQPGGADARLLGVLVFIAAHYHERLTLGDLARAAGFSRAHFSTTFRRATGLAPFEFLRRYRLQRAKELLDDERLSIGAIAAAVGMPDPFYFSRVFKRTEGLSPRQYRQAKRRPGFP
jgi:AraC-like DNA-binding protein/quercetin dioxygenase-like cupin family protein